MHKLEDLKVYGKAFRLTKEVRGVTKIFPREELFGLTAQCKRAVDSVALNIALENNCIASETYSAIAAGIKEIVAMIYGLQKALTQQSMRPQVSTSHNLII